VEYRVGIDHNAMVDVETLQGEGERRRRNQRLSTRPLRRVGVADRMKQLLKNSVYRALGETTAAMRVNGHAEPRLRVLMYHKINDRPGNPGTVPTTMFAEQMAQLRELGYPVVGLDAVVAHYGTGAPLPPRSVLLTFDDGYHDHLENALPVLQQHGYPAAMFVPVAYLEDTRPLPHERRLAARGLVNRTLDWGELAELAAAGVGIGSHGMTHRVLSELEVDEAAREITLSKLHLEERLGRPVRAFAYPKGAEGQFKGVHANLAREAGYDVAFTSVTGTNSASTDPMRLRRYNVEPYASRTFELVLAGSCDLIAIKDTVRGTQSRRLLNVALRTSRE
jgi:peptidoglycan/xylan/chitin deacetylase (PgdA/CDA1 family)